MVIKINISIPKDVLEELDRVAKESRTSRSRFLVEALKHHLKEMEEAREREQRMQAAETIIKIADEIGPWDATAEILKWRQRH